MREKHVLFSLIYHALEPGYLCVAGLFGNAMLYALRMGSGFTLVWGGFHTVDWTFCFIYYLILVLLDYCGSLGAKWRVEACCGVSCVLSFLFLGCSGLM